MKLLLLVVLLLSACGGGGNTFSAPDYKVTDGIISYDSNTGFYTESGESRMDIVSDGESMKLDLVYLGPTEKKAYLASGAIAEQFGMKLRNMNTCNLVYVMYTISGQVIISVKSNPGMTTHEQCADRGYTLIRKIQVKPLAIGERVTMSGSFSGDTLSVALNNNELFTGPIAFQGKGIAGIRTDNTKVRFNYE